MEKLYDMPAVTRRAVTTTAANMTDAQVRQLRADASDADDLATVIMCDRALGGTDTADDYTPPDPRDVAAVNRALEMTQGEAWTECAARISEGKSARAVTA